MEGEEINSDYVTVIPQECSRIPAKQDSSITKEIFDSAARFRTKHMLDKALQMRQNPTIIEVHDDANVIDLNDTEDFKEAPKFRRKLRLKTKSSSSSNAIFSDVIVISEKNPSQNLADLHKNNHILPLVSKDKVINEGFTYLKELVPTNSKEHMNLVPEDDCVNKISHNSLSELATNQGISNFQTCLVCGVDVDIGMYKTHSLNCLRQNFSKPDKGQNIERTVQVKCHICSISITHMNSQRRAQHINKCIDEKDAARHDEITYQQQLLAARTAVLSCPMCGRKFKVQSSRLTHLKRCAVTNKMTVDQVKNLVKQQEEEHQTKLNAGILPEDFKPAKPKLLQQKYSKNSKSKGQLDEDTQLALALSTSLAENQNEDLVHLGLVGSAGKEEQVVAGRGHGKNKKGKFAASASLLMTLSKEEAMDRISNRITRYIFSSNQNGPDPDTPPFKMRKQGHPSSSSSALLVIPSSPILWSKASLDMSALRSSQSLMEMTGDLRFYVKELMPPVSVNTVFAGSKLRRVSTIPGRRMSEEIEQHIETETDTNTSINSLPTSQTVDILTKLAMESDQDMGENVEYRLSDVETEFKQEDEVCDLQASGFCQESPVKVESDPSDIVSSYLGLVDCPRFSDIVIIADNQAEIHAHKLILHARCPELLSMSLMKDGEEVIDLTSYGKESILCMLNYVYAGYTSLYTSCIADVKHLADRFSVTGLKAAACSAVENLSVDNVTRATSECKNERDTDEDDNSLEERNERDAFDENDWLDVFQTQRENLKQRNESVDISDLKSENAEVMELYDGPTENCNKENETLIVKNEVVIKDICENNVRTLHTNERTLHTNERTLHTNERTHHINVRTLHTNERTLHTNIRTLHTNERTLHTNERTLHTNERTVHTNERTLHTNETIIKLENTFQEYDKIYGKHLETNNNNNNIADMSVRNGNKEAFHSNEEKLQTFPLKRTNPQALEYNLEMATPNIKGKNHSSESGPEMKTKRRKRNTTTIGAGLGSVQLKILGCSLLTGHSSLADETIESLDLNTSKVSLLTGHSSLADETMESVDLNTSKSPLLIGYNLPADVTKGPTEQKNNTSVSSQVRKRKRKKVSKKEFTTLVHKALSTMSDTTVDIIQQPQACLSDEDIMRIQIKIEQGLQAIDDPNDSVYIPSVLEDAVMDQDEVIITHADIKTPLKLTRKQGKKSLPMNHSPSPALQTTANQSLYGASSLTNQEHITIDDSVLMENVLLPISLRPTTVNSTPMTLQKTALVKKSIKTDKTHKMLPPISLTQTTVNSTSVTPQKSALMKKSSKAAQSYQIKATSSLSAQECDSTPKQLSPSIHIQLPGKACVTKLPRNCLSKSSRKNTSQSSQSSDVSVDKSLTPQPTSFKSTGKSLAEDKSPLNSPNSSRLSDSISNNLYKDRLKSCTAQNYPFSSSLPHTNTTSLSTKYTDAEYISGEELFSDDEEESRSSNSKVMPLHWFNLSFDEEKSRPSNSKTLPTELLGPSVDDDKNLRPSNSKELLIELHSPSVDDKNLRPSNSKELPIELLSPSVDDDENSKPSNSKELPTKLLSPSVDDDTNLRQSNSKELPKKLLHSSFDEEKNLRPSNSKELPTKMLSPSVDGENESRPSSSETRSSKWLCPSDPSWMLSTHSMSCSSASKQIANKTITQEGKSVHRDIFTLESAGTPATSTLHLTNPSTDTLKPTHQRVCVKSHNSAVDLPHHSQFVIPFPDIPLSKEKKDAATKSKLKESAGSPSAINIPQTLATLPKDAVDIRDTSSLTAASTLTPNDIQMTSVLKPQVSTPQMTSVLKPQVSSVSTPQMTSVLKPQVSSVSTPLMTSTLKPQLKIHSSIIISPDKKTPESFDAVRKPYSVKNIPMQENLVNPHHYSSSDSLVLSVPRTSSAVNNSIPATQPERNKICENSPKDAKLCQNFASFHYKSPHKSGLISDHVPSIEVFPQKLVTISSCKEVPLTSNPRQFQLEKTSLTREPRHEAEFIDSDDLLRQRLGLSNPFQTISGTKGRSELNSQLGSSSSMRVETIVQSAGLRNKGSELNSQLGSSSSMRVETIVQSAGLRNKGSELNSQLGSSSSMRVETIVQSAGLRNKGSELNSQLGSSSSMRVETIVQSAGLRNKGSELNSQLGSSSSMRVETIVQSAGLRNKGSELNSQLGSSSSMRVETIVQRTADKEILGEKNVDILNLDDSMCMEDSDDLLVVSPEKTCSKTPQHQTFKRIMKNKKRAWKVPSPFTPMAPYDEMATPELKKAVTKIGVRPLGKKRMRELLKHVYQETHKYETDSDYDGTPVKHKRDNSQSSKLSPRAMLSHLPITTSGVPLIHNKLKPATKKANSKKLSYVENKKTNLITEGHKCPDAQHRKEPQSQVLKTHERFPESSGDCALMPENTGDSHEEISGSQDSSYSDGADLPEESILQGWPEDDVAPSQLMQTNSQAVKDKLVQFVHHNKDVYESILMYEPLELDVLKKKLSDAAIRVNMSQVMDFLDERCITFTMKNMSSRNNNRQRKGKSKHSGKSPSKSKTLSQRTAMGSQLKNH